MRPKRVTFHDVQHRLRRFVKEQFNEHRNPHEVADLATRHIGEYIDPVWVMIIRKGLSRSP